MADNMTTTCPMSEICSGRFSAIDARLDRMVGDVTELKSNQAAMKQQIVDGFESLGGALEDLRKGLLGNGHQGKLREMDDAQEAIGKRVKTLEEHRAERRGVWLAICILASSGAFVVGTGIAMIEMFHHWGIK